MGNDTEHAATTVDVVELTPEEEDALLDKEARRVLRISGEEFARRWKAGEYRDSEDPAITMLAMLIRDAG